MASARVGETKGADDGGYPFMSKRHFVIASPATPILPGHIDQGKRMRNAKKIWA
jgi:hypothetical protein